MALYRIFEMKSSTILRLYGDREFIDTSPEYQRMPDVWTLEKKQLLIDSILNEFDLPKLYFHIFSSKESNKKGSDYAVIDGQQRLNAIWEFVEGGFALSEEMDYYIDDEIDLKGLTYNDIANQYQRIKVRFDSYVLPITIVETDDLEMIDDMFGRLNEAVPLNGAEKRNALGGPMPRIIRSVAKHQLFAEKVRFSNRRYQHLEVACRLLFIEFTLHQLDKVVDTKKPYMDAMVKLFKSKVNKKIGSVGSLKSRVEPILELLNGVFIKSDSLLSAQASVPIYYLTVRQFSESDDVEKFNRSALFDFRKKLTENRSLAEVSLTEADFELLEYERLSQQGTNDANSIIERVRILKKHLVG